MLESNSAARSKLSPHQVDRLEWLSCPLDHPNRGTAELSKTSLPQCVESLLKLADELLAIPRDQQMLIAQGLCDRVRTQAQPRHHLAPHRTGRGCNPAWRNRGGSHCSAMITADATPIPIRMPATTANVTVFDPPDG